MLQSDRFCRFFRTSVRLRFTCASYFEGMPYAVSSMTRPGSLLVGGIGNGAALAAPPAASAPPVSAAVLRRKFLRLRTTESRSGLFDMGLLPCDELSMRASLRGGNKPSSFHSWSAPPRAGFCAKRCAPHREHANPAQSPLI